MSYTFSPELVAASLEANCLDTDAFALSNGSLTLNPSCLHDKQTEHSHPSPSGMTRKRLTDDLGAGLLISWLAASRAKTSALPEKALELMASEAGYGVTLPGSLARFDPATHSLKTAQRSLIEDLTGFCVTLPRSGSMRNGWCSEQKIVVPPISANESGFLPTPLKDDWKGGTTAPHSKTGKPRTDQFRHWIKIVHGLTYPIPEHSEAVMGWPIGHSDLKPLATGRFQEWRQQHSIY